MTVFFRPPKIRHVRVPPNRKDGNFEELRIFFPPPQRKCNHNPYCPTKAVLNTHWKDCTLTTDGGGKPIRCVFRNPSRIIGEKTPGRLHDAREVARRLFARSANEEEKRRKLARFIAALDETDDLLLFSIGEDEQSSSPLP